jgi:hypothetical protein
MSIKLGMECKAYYGVAGSQATTEMPNLKNVTLGLSKAEADVTTRGNAGWRAMVGTLKEGSVEFEMVWDPDEGGFAALKDAWFNNTAIALLIMDGDKAVAGSEGLDADFSVIEFQRTENLEEAVMASVTVKPTYSTRAPSWLVVS